MEEFLVSIDEEPETLVINDRWGVEGALEVSVKDNAEPSLKNIDKEFIIKGALKTVFYERDLRKIESRRYVIDDIEVYEENYESVSDNILYKFTSGNFRVKYQTAQAVDVQKLIKEQNNGKH